MGDWPSSSEGETGLVSARKSLPRCPSCRCPWARSEDKEKAERAAGAAAEVPRPKAFALEKGAWEQGSDVQRCSGAVAKSSPLPASGRQREHPRFAPGSWCIATHTPLLSSPPKRPHAAPCNEGLLGQMGRGTLHTRSHPDLPRPSPVLSPPGSVAHPSAAAPRGFARVSIRPNFPALSSPTARSTKHDLLFSNTQVPDRGSGSLCAGSAQKQNREPCLWGAYEHTCLICLRNHQNQQTSSGHLPPRTWSFLSRRLGLKPAESFTAKQNSPGSPAPTCCAQPDTRSREAQKLSWKPKQLRKITLLLGLHVRSLTEPKKPWKEQEIRTK